MHAQQLAQLWTQRLRAFLADVVVCSYITPQFRGLLKKHTPHAIPSNHNTYTLGSVHAYSTACPTADPAPSLLPRRCDSLLIESPESMNPHRQQTLHSAYEKGQASACSIACPSEAPRRSLLPRPCHCLFMHPTPIRHTPHVSSTHTKQPNPNTYAKGPACAAT